MNRLKKIEDIIAEGIWHCYTHDGKERPTKITIGRPVQAHEDLDKGWYCPFQIEGFTEGINTAMGEGPLDALINAMNFLNQFFYVTGVAPGFGGPRTNQKKKTTTKSSRSKNKRTNLKPTRQSRRR